MGNAAFFGVSESAAAEAAAEAATEAAAEAADAVEAAAKFVVLTPPPDLRSDLEKFGVLLRILFQQLLVYYTS
jgi:hypothetical protein